MYHGLLSKEGAALTWNYVSQKKKWSKSIEIGLIFWIQIDIGTSSQFKASVARDFGHTPNTYIYMKVNKGL